jgi:hypothetical protein
VKEINAKDKSAQQLLANVSSSQMAPVITEHPVTQLAQSLVAVGRGKYLFGKQN